jgi:predicted permease
MPLRVAAANVSATRFPSGPVAAIGWVLVVIFGGVFLTRGIFGDTSRWTSPVTLGGVPAR